MAKITLGPVIGKVTSESGRVLLESDSDSDVTCIAVPRNGKEVRQVKSFQKNRPSAFHLGGLRPDTDYEIRFEGVRTDRTGTLKTLEPDPSKINIGAVSCNFTVKRGNTNLWADLRDRYVSQREISLLLHLGDQVYGDNSFLEALHILNGKTKGTMRQEKQILELYRQLYRWTWNDPATQEVLANVSNLMIWDDHEIRDDWGSLESDRDAATAQYYIGTLARRVFREYQRQLWDDSDPDTITDADLEYHFHDWGQIAVVLLDQRGGRSFQTDSSRPYLGTKQWVALQNALQKPRVRALVVVTSVPLAYLSSDISGIGSHLMDDLMDHWSYGPHRKEQVELIRLLRYWKDEVKGERELLVVAGDVHIGGYTDIKRRGNTIFKQLITSPITNTPPKWYEFQGVRFLMEAQQNLGERYSFEHHDFTNRRNYGVILVRIPPAGTPKVDGTLVEAVTERK